MNATKNICKEMFKDELLIALDMIHDEAIDGEL